MKKMLFISAFLMLASLSFSQGKGKSKSKNNSKTQTSVPSPQGNPTKLPEVKEKPEVYQQNDSTKNPSGQQDKGKGKTKKQPGNSGKDSSNNDNSNNESWNKDKKQNEAEHEDGDDNNNGKKKVKNKNNKENKEEDDDHDSDQYQNKENKKNKDKGNGNSKVRTNIPTQVRNSFNADYPNASDAVWTKQQGDWTVNFRNYAYRSTATYHSNGERVDTRTSMPSQQAPAPVLGEIQKRFPQANPKDIIKIEKPKNPNLFQVMINEGGKLKTILFDEKGKLVSEQ
jgi:hypothetical protein